MTTGARLWGAAPPRQPPRRVVITGLGLVTPLGVGVEASWQALVAGGTGVRALTEEDLPATHRGLLPQLACRVAALVPRQQLAPALEALQEVSGLLAHLGHQLQSNGWCTTMIYGVLHASIGRMSNIAGLLHVAFQQDARRAAPWMLYGMLAADEALRDAGWDPHALPPASRAATGVSFGTGMSSCAEIGDAWTAMVGGLCDQPWAALMQPSYLRTSRHLWKTQLLPTILAHSPNGYQH